MSFLSTFDMLLFAGVFAEAATQWNSEKESHLHVQEFSKEYMASSFIVKQLPFLFIVKT